MRHEFDLQGLYLGLVFQATFRLFTCTQQIFLLSNHLEDQFIAAYSMRQPFDAILTPLGKSMTVSTANPSAYISYNELLFAL